MCVTERELMLIKLRAPAGPTRTEVLQLAEIFRARVVDVSDNAITLCLSGDPGKVRPLCKHSLLLLLQSKSRVMYLSITLRTQGGYAPVFACFLRPLARTYSLPQSRQ